MDSQQLESIKRIMSQDPPVASIPDPTPIAAWLLVNNPQPSSSALSQGEAFTPIRREVNPLYDASTSITDMSFHQYPGASSGSVLPPYPHLGPVFGQFPSSSEASSSSSGSKKECSASTTSSTAENIPVPHQLSGQYHNSVMAAIASTASAAVIPPSTAEGDNQPVYPGGSNVLGLPSGMYQQLSQQIPNLDAILQDTNSHLRTEKILEIMASLSSSLMVESASSSQGSSLQAPPSGFPALPNQMMAQQPQQDRPAAQPRPHIDQPVVMPTLQQLHQTPADAGMMQHPQLPMSQREQIAHGGGVGRPHSGALPQHHPTLQQPPVQPVLADQLALLQQRRGAAQLPYPATMHHPAHPPVQMVQPQQQYQQQFHLSHAVAPSPTTSPQHRQSLHIVHQGQIHQRHTQPHQSNQQQFPFFNQAVYRPFQPAPHVQLQMQQPQFAMAAPVLQRAASDTHPPVQPQLTTLQQQRLWINQVLASRPPHQGLPPLPLTLPIHPTEAQKWLALYQAHCVQAEWIERVRHARSLLEHHQGLARRHALQQQAQLRQQQQIQEQQTMQAAEAAARSAQEFQAHHQEQQQLAMQAAEAARNAQQQHHAMAQLQLRPAMPQQVQGVAAGTTAAQAPPPQQLAQQCPSQLFGGQDRQGDDDEHARRAAEEVTRRKTEADTMAEAKATDELRQQQQQSLPAGSQEWSAQQVSPISLMRAHLIDRPAPAVVDPQSIADAPAVVSPTQPQKGTTRKKRGPPRLTDEEKAARALKKEEEKGEKERRSKEKKEQVKEEKERLKKEKKEMKERENDIKEKKKKKSYNVEKTEAEARENARLIVEADRLMMEEKEEQSSVNVLRIKQEVPDYEEMIAAEATRNRYATEFRREARRQERIKLEKGEAVEVVVLDVDADANQDNQAATALSDETAALDRNMMVKNVTKKRRASTFQSADGAGTHKKPRRQKIHDGKVALDAPSTSTTGRAGADSTISPPPGRQDEQPESQEEVLDGENDLIDEEEEMIMDEVGSEYDEDDERRRPEATVDIKNDEPTRVVSKVRGDGRPRSNGLTAASCMAAREKRRAAKSAKGEEKKKTPKSEFSKGNITKRKSVNADGVSFDKNKCRELRTLGYDPKAIAETPKRKSTRPNLYRGPLEESFTLDESFTDDFRKAPTAASFYTSRPSSSKHSIDNGGDNESRHNEEEQTMHESFESMEVLSPHDSSILEVLDAQLDAPDLTPHRATTLREGRAMVKRMEARDRNPEIGNTDLDEIRPYLDSDLFNFPIPVIADQRIDDTDEWVEETL